MSKPWGGIGAWAADVEREEEEREAAAIPQLLGAAGSQSFPSLKEAAAAKPKKKKPMTLSEFTTGSYVGHGAARRDSSMESKGLTPDEMRRLPTGPKERSAEEMELGRLGGGFKSYGRTSGPPGGNRGRGDDGDGSWSGGRRSYGGFDDERRAPPPRVSDFDQPSRADEVDNWAMGKKSLPSMDSGRQDRYSSLGSGSGSGGGSRADEVDNWAIGKKAPPSRSTGFGSGFRESGAPESNRWSRGGQREGDRERPRLVINPPQGDGSLNEPTRTTKPNPFGAARPREEVLAEKGLDWRKVDSENEIRKTSRPTSSHSSRPSSAHSSRAESESPHVLEGAPKARPKVNPFGDAKPREILLQEQGKDWRKIDLELEHRSVDRPETEEEKMLKERIAHLEKEQENEAAKNGNGESVQGSGGEQTSLHEQILSRKKDLELLTRELDDKIRFGQKSTDRPGSGAGRFGFPDRPPSQSGVPEETRNLEFMDRPRSRGKGDAWARPADDRRAFQGGGRERGFFNNRDIDRPRSRERW